MSEIDDGGPAFPRPNVRGMSLRDWFAGQALASMIALNERSMGPHASIAKKAFAIADAMIEARKVKP